MSSYRSAYENYYKNINNFEKGKKDKSKFSIFDRKTNNPIRPIYGANSNNYNKMDFIIKRVIKELTGATIILLFFAALKYIPTAQVQEMHANCKQAINYNFNYDQCIDEFNTIEIGNVKIKDLKIGNYTTEDLKMENLKVKALSFMDYLKNNRNMQY